MNSNQHLFGKFEFQFDAVFYIDDLGSNYMTYLKSKHQDEPLLFLISAKEFRIEPDRISAQMINKTYIHDGAEREVNLSGATKATIVKKLEQLETSYDYALLKTIFDEAFVIVYLELMSDSFHRYLHSKTFIDFIKYKDSNYLNKIGRIPSEMAISGLNRSEPKRTGWRYLRNKLSCLWFDKICTFKFTSSMKA
ncbi:regulator of G-protein signaling [Acrasis kona]|uniref:Regulator of G-protein signaling n=1 Tax=Acrasis kona TaxID=1008807 RepID=A0AAW2Z4M7_9EUKA